MFRQKKEENRLRALEIDFRRTSYAVSKMDRIRNDIIRVEEQRWPSKMCEWTPYVRRNKGKPRVI